MRNPVFNTQCKYIHTFTLLQELSLVYKTCITGKRIIITSMLLKYKTYKTL